MKKIWALSLSLIIAFSMNAQPYLRQSSLYNRPAERPATFHDIEKAFKQYWEGRQPSAVESENAKDGGWQQFKRWEWFVKQRTLPSGVFPSPEILYQQFQVYKQQLLAEKSSGLTAANWSFIGPSVVPSNGGGSGRVNCIAFHPSNPNTIFIGAACGGLWKSTDGGTTWAVHNTDLLPSISISDIVIDPSNPQIMYLATGDKYGIYHMYETWGHYSAGVLKSTDGGLTWSQTGLNYSLSNIAIIQRLIIDSANTSNLLAATLSGIFKTTNGGTSWTNVKAGKIYDLEYHPTNSQIVYAADSIGVFRSANGGTSWTATTVASTGRASLAVSRNSPNTVYAWTPNNFYASTDGGITFNTRTNPSGYCTPYGYYDMVLAASAANANILFAGGLRVCCSTDGGSTWTTVSDWNTFPQSNYVHADQKAFAFLPGSATTVFACNDGGVFRSTDQGATWSDKSNGIHIKQYYRFSGSALTPNLFIAGAQDNGTDKITGSSSASMINGADGEDCLIDFTNDNIMFYSSQGGQFRRSTNGGTSSSSLSIGGCDWTSPIYMDPNNHNVVFIGGSVLHKSIDNGVNWTSSSGFDGTCLYSVRSAKSNSNYVYVATFKNIYRSTNGGVNFNAITGALPVGNAAITGIAISDTDPDQVWVCFSGFSSGNKVYRTTNGGASWQNVSGTLPNIPVNCIEFQNGSNELLYIGTDLGVFYTDATQGNWIAYNTGLPNVIVNDLEINYPTSKIRAGTFGRGIWESNLQTSTLVNLDAGTMAMLDPASFTCDTVIIPKVRIRNSGGDTIFTVNLHYRMDQQPFQMYSWSGVLPSLATADITLPTYTFTSGTHTLTAYTSMPNASADQNAQNDTIRSSFTILVNPASIPPPIQEGFVSTTFPPATWAVENSSQLLSRTAACGGYGNSSSSMKVDFLNIPAGTDVLESSYIDFAQLTPPIYMLFDVAYASYSTTYFDSMRVELYDDCSGLTSVVFKNGYPGMSTAVPTTNPFVPTASQWRTDSVNLDTLAGYHPLKIRFAFTSDYGNNLYLDNINLVGTPVGVSAVNPIKPGIRIYPSPSNGIVTVQSTQPMDGWRVFNMMGDKIWSTDEAGNIITLDLSHQPEGIYLVQAVKGTVQETRKVIIAR